VHLDSGTAATATTGISDKGAGEGEVAFNSARIPVAVRRISDIVICAKHRYSITGIREATQAAVEKCLSRCNILRTA
jgi:hypothetical protein